MHYAFIDIIRGIASLSVFLTHWTERMVEYSGSISGYSGFFDAFFRAAGGIHPGVITFLVLSGFCIHLPQALDPLRVSNRRFLRLYACRRSCRILPVYWAGLLLGLFVHAFAIYISSNSQAALPLQYDPTLLSSFVGASEVIRFFNYSNFYIGNEPLATVAVELLIYSIYPFLFLSYYRFGLSVIVVVAFSSYSVIAVSRLLGVDSTYINSTIFELIVYWVIGAFGAEIYSRKQKVVINNLYILCCMLLLSLALYSVTSNFLWFKGFHIFGTFYFALLISGILIVAVTCEPVITISDCLKPIESLLSRIGSRSFSLYVVHTPSISFTITVLESNSPSWMPAYPIVTFIAVLSMTEIIYRCIERPSKEFAKAHFN
jgi:peptidoglycan/LPS O-acetylase OafA/YrhL